MADRLRGAGFTLVVFLVVGMLAVWEGHRVLSQPLVVPPGGMTVQLGAGDTLHGLTARLADRGVISAPRRLVWAARLSGRELGVKAGEYELLPHMRAIDLVDRMAAGQTLLHALTVIEGWSFRQLRAALSRHPAIEVTLAEVPDEAVMAAIGRPGRHPEGRFLPDTYLFERGTTDTAFLGRAAAAMERYLETAWAGRDGGLPFTAADEALVLASIVEKEARIPDERALVAGVFVRRLQQDMRLQADPTVVYGLGQALEDRLRSRHLQADTPYNTYTRHGLPPTPIAMPGARSIDAVMHPAQGDALYFVARGDGSHHFSATLEEHNRAVARYQLQRGQNGR